MTERLQPGIALAVRLARDEAAAVTDAAEYGIHAAGTVISYAAQAGSRVYHQVTKAAEAIGRTAVHLLKTAYHDTAKVAAAAAFVKRHAALIVSIEVGGLVFAGCEAATVGIGSIGCAAPAGAGVLDGVLRGDCGADRALLHRRPADGRGDRRGQPPGSCRAPAQSRRPAEIRG